MTFHTHKALGFNGFADGVQQNVIVITPSLPHGEPLQLHVVNELTFCD